MSDLITVKYDCRHASTANSSLLSSSQAEPCMRRRLPPYEVYFRAVSFPYFISLVPNVGTHIWIPTTQVTSIKYQVSTYFG